MKINFKVFRPTSSELFNKRKRVDLRTRIDLYNESAISLINKTNACFINGIWNPTDDFASYENELNFHRGKLISFLNKRGIDIDLIKGPASIIPLGLHTFVIARVIVNNVVTSLIKGMYSTL